MSDNSTPASLDVWSSDATDASPIVQALEKAYRVNRLRGLDDIPSDSGADRSVLLIHVAPELALARAMANDVAPRQALADWQEETRRLLAANRQDRRGIRLLNIAEVRAYPKRFRTYFKLPESSGPSFPLRNQHDDPFLLTLARSMLLGDAESRVLAAELDAVSINLSGQEPGTPIDPEAVFRDYQKLRASERDAETLRQRASEQEDELHSTQEQLRKERAALAEVTARSERLQSENDALNRERETLARRVEDAEAKSADLTEQIELLSAQAEAAQAEAETLAHQARRLENVAAELPKLRKHLGERDRSLRATDEMFRKLRAEQQVLASELKRAEQKLTNSRAETAQLRGELAHVLGSHSLRLTAPLRRLRSALTGRRSS